MIDFTSGVWLYFTILLSIVIVALAYIRMMRMREWERTLVVISLLAGLFLFLSDGVGTYVLIALEIGIVTFNGLLSGKTSKLRNVYVSLSLLYIALLHWVGFILIGQAMLIGILSGITNIREYKNRIVNARVEVERDFFHMGIGIFLMLLFYFESSPVAITGLIVMILGGIFAISVTEMFRDKKISGFIFKLERNGASLGYGAMWLALGALVAVSFLDTNNILVVFSAIFIGDPAATMVGLGVGGKKLPYNSRKSISGTLAYFIVTAALSYLFIGMYAILVALVAALVESLKTKLDDNLTVSIALTALLLALRV